MVRHAVERRLNLPDAMAMEYRCLARTLRRPDFVTAQLCKRGGLGRRWPREEADWDGARGRPRWEHDSVDDVDPAEVADCVERPLEWERDGTVELWLPVEHAPA
eukprot:gene11799-21243_t